MNSCEYDLFILDECLSPITSHQALTNHLIHLIGNAGLDQGDTEKSYHIEVKAGLKLKRGDVVAHTLLKGFAELNLYADTPNLCIYVCPALSENEEFCIIEEAMGLDSSLNAVGLRQELCNLFHQKVAELSIEEATALTRVIKLKNTGAALDIPSPAALAVLQNISAIDQFILNDQQDWFYFSEVLIHEAGKALDDAIDHLDINESVQSAIQNLKHLEFTELSIMLVLYDLMSKGDFDLVKLCLNQLKNKQLLNEGFFVNYPLQQEHLEQLRMTYQALPILKPVDDLIIDIQKNL